MSGTFDFDVADRAHVWHPYTRFSTLADGPPPRIVRGEGIHLFDAAGRLYVDAISSWWCAALGHGHPKIVEAIRRQAGELQHSILGNLSHPRAIELAARLARLMPSPDRHVLFASDGASAVEQALKIAVQYWSNAGQPQRHRFACLADAYHGDTLGAMSVGYQEAWHRPFRKLMSEAVVIPFEETLNVQRSTFNVQPLEQNAAELAAVIVEPLCLGAAGMKMYPAEGLRQLGAWSKEHGVLVIVDEIAMGFGRTGRMFAFEHAPRGAGQAGIDPDIVCVGKALSAGYLPISATIVKDRLYETFGDERDGGVPSPSKLETPRPRGVVRDHTLQHGHTFSGNPIACAAALAALDVYEEPGFMDEVRRKAEILSTALRPLSSFGSVRTLGLIGAVELAPDARPQPESRGHRIRKRLLDRGVLLRPLGSVLYVMPPLTIREDELRDLASALCECCAAEPV